MTDPDTISADYTLRPSELAATLALLVEARQPTLVWGPPGTAKSMIAQQVAADAGRQYVDVRALLLDPVDHRERSPALVMPFPGYTPASLPAHRRCGAARRNLFEHRRIDPERRGRTGFRQRVLPCRARPPLPSPAPVPRREPCREGTVRIPAFPDGALRMPDPPDPGVMRRAASRTRAHRM